MTSAGASEQIYTLACVLACPCPQALHEAQVITLRTIKSMPFISMEIRRMATVVTCGSPLFPWESVESVLPSITSRLDEPICFVV